MFLAATVCAVLCLTCRGDDSEGTSTLFHCQEHTRTFTPRKNYIFYKDEENSLK